MSPDSGPFPKRAASAGEKRLPQLAHLSSPQVGERRTGSREGLPRRAEVTSAAFW